MPDNITFSTDHMKRPILIAPLSRNALIALLVIVVLGILIYINSFRVPYVLDDYTYVVNNPVIREFHYLLSPRDIATGTILSPAVRSAFMTRIIGYLTLAANYKLNGLDIFGYHVVNLLLHILNAWMLFLIATHIFKDIKTYQTELDAYYHIGISLFVSLLFLCHPIQTQAVVYITSRFVLLASFFSLLSIVAYIRARTSVYRGVKVSWTVLAILSISAGMLTKEFTFTLPLIIALYEFIFFEGNLREKFQVLCPYALTLPIIPILIFVQAGSPRLLDDTMRTITAADVSQISRFDYLITQFTVIFLYLRLLFLPIDQNIDHDIPVQNSLASIHVLSSLIILLVLFSCAVYAIKRSLQTTRTFELRIFSFGIIWFFITLSVESSIIPLGELSAEYRLYLPSIGIILAIVSVFSAFMHRFKLSRAVTLAIAASVIMIICVLTLYRILVWQSAISLWQDASRKSPAKARPYNNLGNALLRAGRAAEAVPLIERSISINPNYPKSWSTLGAALVNSERPMEAVSVLQHTISIDPLDATAHYNLGIAYLLLNDNASAINYFLKTINLNPSIDDAYIKLADAYNRIGHYSETIRLLESIYGQIDNRAEGHFNLCVAYAKMGRTEEAKREMNAVFRHDTHLGLKLENDLKQGGFLN